MAKTRGALELGARSAEIVQSAIQHWLESELLSESQATQLANTVVARTFDWEKFAKYSIRLALISLAIAVSSLVFSASFLRIIGIILMLPAGLRGFLTALIAVGIHVFAYDRSLKLPKQKYVNEGIHGIGALVFALAALQFIEQLSFYYVRKHEITLPEGEPKSEEYKDGDAARQQRKREYEVRSRLMGNAIWCVTMGLAVVYATVALLSKSNLIWTCAIMVFSSCIGGSGGYFGGGYWIDMESPFLFIGFGTLLLAMSRLMSSYAITEPLWSTTRIWGLLYSFVSLWILSIWGYDDYFDKDAKRSPLSRRLRMALWSLVFLLASATSLWHGLRYDDSTTKGYGLSFLGINLYTKYFECFWGWSKPVFFALLALSLAVVGKYAENVWTMRVEELKLI